MTELMLQKPRQQRLRTHFSIALFRRRPTCTCTSRLDFTSDALGLLVEVQQPCIHVRSAFLGHTLSTDGFTTEHVLGSTVHWSAVTTTSSTQSVYVSPLKLPIITLAASSAGILMRLTRGQHATWPAYIPARQ